MRLFIKVDSIVTPETADRAVFIWVSKRNWFCINYATTGLENSRHFFCPIRNQNQFAHVITKTIEPWKSIKQGHFGTRLTLKRWNLHWVLTSTLFTQGQRNGESCPFTKFNHNRDCNFLKCAYTAAFCSN